MDAEFLYKGPLRIIGLWYSGPPWIFLAAVVLLVLALLHVMS